MKNNKGFSLVELIVVIAIMAVLVGVLAPTLLRYVEKSRQQKDESAFGEFIQAVKIAAADEDAYDNIPDAGVTFSIANGTLTVGTGANITGASYAGAIADEAAATVGDSISFKSKAYSSLTGSVVVTKTETGIAIDKETLEAVKNGNGNQQPDPNPAG